MKHGLLGDLGSSGLKISELVPGSHDFGDCVCGSVKDDAGEPANWDALREVWSRIEDAWCSMVHDAPMWPIHGYYTCRVCLRKHAVPWSN